MKKQFCILTILLAFGFCNFCEGQGKDTIVNSTLMPEDIEILHYKNVYDKPEFPGGDKAFSQYLLNNLRYPRKAKKNNVQGLVKLSFIVEPDGSLTNIKIVTGLDKYCNKEALQLVKKMPKWLPKKQNGKFVKSEKTIDIHFNP